MDKKKSKIKIFAKIAVSLLMAFFLLLAAASNYMVDYAIGREGGASSAISDSLVTYESDEQQQIEERAEATKKIIRAEAEAWTKVTPKEAVAITATDGVSLTGFYIPRRIPTITGALCCMDTIAVLIISVTMPRNIMEKVTRC